MGKSGMEIKHIKELDIMDCIVLWNVWLKDLGYNTER
jgi:hypothetical protein